MSWYEHLKAAYTRIPLPEIVKHDLTHLNNVFNLMMQLQYFNNFNKDVVKMLTTAIYFHDIGLMKGGREYPIFGLPSPLNCVIERQMHGYFSSQMIRDKERIFYNCIREAKFSNEEIEQIAIACEYHQNKAPINDKVIDIVNDEKSKGTEPPAIFKNLPKLEPDVKFENVMLVVSLLRFIDCCDTQENRVHGNCLDIKYIKELIDYYNNKLTTKYVKDRWPEWEEKNILWVPKEIYSDNEKLKYVKERVMYYLIFLIKQPWHHLKHFAFSSVEIIQNDSKNGLNIVYTMNMNKFDTELNKRIENFNTLYGQIESVLDGEVSNELEKEIAAQKSVLLLNSDDLIKRIKDKVVYDLEEEWKIVGTEIKSKSRYFAKSVIFYDPISCSPDVKIIYND